MNNARTASPRSLYAATASHRPFCIYHRWLHHDFKSDVTILVFFHAGKEEVLGLMVAKEGRPVVAAWTMRQAKLPCLWVCFEPHSQKCFLQSLLKETVCKDKPCRLEATVLSDSSLLCIPKNVWYIEEKQAHSSCISLTLTIPAHSELCLWIIYSRTVLGYHYTNSWTLNQKVSRCRIFLHNIHTKKSIEKDKIFL